MIEPQEQRTARAKSINLHTIRKLIEYSFEIILIKATFTPTIFEILMSERRSVLLPAQQGTGNERVKIFTQKNKMLCQNNWPSLSIGH